MNIKEIIRQIINENLNIFEAPDFREGLTYDQLPPQIIDAYKANKAVGVAFVKSDGSVREMAFRRYLKAYIGSTRVKSEKEMNVLQNNNLFQVYDTNVYISNLRELGDKEKASAKSYRRFYLQEVLAFILKGQVYDFREKNKIKERYGENVYMSLTKSMVSALKSQEIAGDNIPIEEEPENNF